jgi:hypothetical protein
MIIERPDVYHSRNCLDFGKGFYLTLLQEQASKYAQRFLLDKDVAYVNEYFLDESYTKFNVKVFPHYDEEWLEYVGLCRMGANDKLYDVVEGGIANDRVFNTLDLYFAGDMSKDDALRRLSYERPNHQLCRLNQEVIDKCLQFITSKVITKQK